MSAFTVAHHGVRWVLEDEDLEPVVAGLVQKGDLRREYSIHGFKDGKIFIKFFSEKGAQGFVRNRLVPRGKREYDVGRLLRRAGVMTPRVLGYGVSAEGSFAITEWVEGVPLSAALEDPDRRRSLLAALARLLKGLAGAGFVHNDLHLENVVAGRDGLYLIDLHKTRKKVRLGRSEELSNLSHALTMIWDDMDEAERAAFFDEYGTPLRTDTEEALARLRARWIRRKAMRAFRSTSRLEASRDRVVVRGMEGQGKGDFLSLIKKDRKVMVQRFSDHIRKVFASGRRLRRAWENHVVLEYMKLPVVPRAYFVETSGVTGSGFVAMEDLGGRGEELDRYLDRWYDAMTYGERRAFAEAFAGFLNPLLVKGISHADLKGCNVFVLGTGDFVLLDVEDVRFAALEPKRLVTMLVQLHTTLPGRIRTRDRLRFFARLTQRLRLDRKDALKRVVEGSAGKEIVYEGVGGLKVEQPEGRR